MKRRDFIKTTVAAGLGYMAAPLIRTTRRTQPYRVALIGSGWWGMNILRTALAAGESKAVALCDVDRADPPQVADEQLAYVPGVRSGRRAPHVWCDEAKGVSILDAFGTDYVVLLTEHADAIS